MSGISTHVLDNSRGRPGRGVDVTLEFRAATGWEVHGIGTTDDEGRIASLLSEEDLVEGTYRLTFETGSYHRQAGLESFYPQVIIVFEVVHSDEHYHIPLLLNAFGYTTYKGR